LFLIDNISKLFSKANLLLRHYHFVKRSKKINLINRTSILGSYSEIHLESKTSFISIDDNFYTRAFCQIRVGPGANLFIGKNVFWNNYTSVTCMYEIRIGNNVMLGEGVKIYDHNHKIDKKLSLTIHRNELTYGSVHIGDNSWIGSNVIILKGVKIGSNCVIGAGCLIHKNIPSNSIVKLNCDLDIVISENI
jgi:acetyltransferase-like isoleucine patch superfamily enzyme